MEEDIKKEIVSEVKSNLEEFKSSLKERIKLPVLVTYCIILVLYNWDIIYYFIFERISPISKIDYIKQCFDNTYYHRYLIPFLFAIVSTFMFPVVQVIINYCFQIFKNLNKRLIQRDEFETVKHEKRILEEKLDNKELRELNILLEEKEQSINFLKSNIFDLEKKIDSDYKNKIQEINGYDYCLDISTKFINNILFPQKVNRGFTLENFKKFYEFYKSSNVNYQKIIEEIFAILEKEVPYSVNYIKQRLSLIIDDNELITLIGDLKSLEMIRDSNDILINEMLVKTETGSNILDLYFILNPKNSHV